MKRSWNKAFLKFLIFIAILPTLIELAWAYLSHMSVMTMLVLAGCIILIALFMQGGLWRVIRSLFSFLILPFMWLFGNFNKGGRFMPVWKRWLFLSPHHKGLVVDGRNRLTPENSYKNLLVQGGVGTGKTAGIILPHLLLQNHASIVATDLSGELFIKCSGDLKRRGFDIQVIDLMRFKQGLGFNPLAEIKTHSEVAQAAHVLIKSSGLDQGSDPFWANAAEKLLRILIQCLVNLNDEAYLNLANLKYLLNSFGNQKAFNEFVVFATLDDTETYHEFIGFISGNEKTISSILTTAQTALSGLAPDLAKMTAINQIDFTQLRMRKTAIFIMVRQQDISQYAFFLNLLFTRLCHTLLSDLKDTKSGLPVDLLLDEFGQLMIPDFEVFAATSRKYRVSFALILQSLSQLEARYGRNQASVIIDAIGSELYFPGAKIELASQLSRRLGKSHKRNQKSPSALMREDEVIHMKDDEALFLHGNKDPIKLKMKRYYEQRNLRKRSEIKPRIRPTNTFPEVSYVPLDIGKRKMAEMMVEPESNTEDSIETGSEGDSEINTVPNPSSDDTNPTTGDMPTSGDAHGNG